MAGGGKIYTVGRIASGAIAASFIVLGQHIVNLTPLLYVVTLHFPNMAMSPPNPLPLTHRLRLHSSFLSRTG
jgi:hypothetical protein